MYSGNSTTYGNSAILNVNNAGVQFPKIALAAEAGKNFVVYIDFDHNSTNVRIFNFRYNSSSLNFNDYTLLHSISGNTGGVQKNEKVLLHIKYTNIMAETNPYTRMSILADLVDGYSDPIWIAINSFYYCWMTDEELAIFKSKEYDPNILAMFTNVIEQLHNKIIPYNNFTNLSYYDSSNIVTSGNGVTITGNSFTTTQASTGVGYPSTKIANENGKTLHVDIDIGTDAKDIDVYLFFGDVGSYGGSFSNTAFIRIYEGKSDTIGNKNRNLSLNWIDINDSFVQYSGVSVVIQLNRDSSDTATYTGTINYFMARFVTENEKKFIEQPWFDNNFIDMMNNVGERIQHVNSYYNITNEQGSKNLFTELHYSGSVEWINDHSVRIPANTNNTGLQTNKIDYQGGDILYRVKATVTHDGDLLNVFVFGHNDEDTDYQWDTFQVIKQIENQTGGMVTEEISFEYDPANFTVYYEKHIQTVSFQIQKSDATKSCTLTVENVSIQEVSSMETGAYYDTDFPTMMDKIQGGIQSANNTIESVQRNVQQAIVKVDPHGNKYDIRIGLNKEIIIIPHIPSKAIFMGNSFLLGLGFYGMCASDHEHDWYYLTTQEILKYNPDCIFYRCQAAWFEQLGTSKTLDAGWNEARAYTGEIYDTIFTNDVDLVIIQLGDNADSTDDRLQGFSNNIEAFCEKIATKCPKARLLWLGSSARYAHTKEATERACAKYGIGLIVINDIRNDMGETAFGAYSQTTYEKPDGSYETVLDAWKSHAGDAGMQEIANRVIEWLDMD